MVIVSRGSIRNLLLWQLSLLSWTGTAASHAASPMPERAPAPAPRERCDLARCDYATGAGCRVSAPPLSHDEAELEVALGELEAYAKRCDVAWDRCYEPRVREGVDELVGVSQHISGLQGRMALLPEVAREVCERYAPERAQSAVDEAPAWCVVGRSECLDGIRAARRVLDAMPDWRACIARMEAYVVDNERIELERAECRDAAPVIEPAREMEPAPTPEPRARRTEPEPERALLDPPAPAPAPRPATAPAPAPASAPKTTPKRLEVVELDHGTVIDAPRGVDPRAQEAPPRDVAATPRDRRERTSPREVERVADAPREDVHKSAERPSAAPTDRRKGQVTLGLTPFSGVLTIRDPANAMDYEPMLASVRIGVDFDVSLGDALVLEVGLGGRLSFGSTAFEQAIGGANSDTVDPDTGSAFIVELEPSALVLSDYIGGGIVADVRWDTIGTTSISGGVVSTKASGTAGGLRLVVGLGLLAREMRLFGTLDWLFVGAGEAAVRAGLEADLGGFFLAGAYRQHFRLGDADDAHVVDNLELTLGYRMVY